MDISIRRATADDADFLAWVMLAASRAHLSRGVWDLLVGTDEAGCLDYLQRLAVAEPRSLCHFESFWVAEADGHTGGALCGFELRSGGGWAIVGEAMGSVQRELGWTEADIAASQNRIAAVRDCFLPDIGADWGIENVATRTEYRRRGLANRLVEQAIHEGRQRGCRLAQITTFIGNDAAQSVYKGAGFVLSDEIRFPQMASVLNTPGFVRLIRPL
jgi:ribosomal protein S18 acetylase RimI-like enzyme